MDRVENQNDAMIAAYDEEAEASGWFGPEVVFGLIYTYVQPGQSILDIGIATGLGSVLFREAGLKVYGVDISPKMLDACRSKGFTALQLHDLSKPPYPCFLGIVKGSFLEGVYVHRVTRRFITKFLICFSRTKHVLMLRT